MRKSLSIPLIVVLVVVVLLVVLRLALPGFVLDALNENMEQMGEEYRGEVGDVDIAIFRGAYRLSDVTIRKVQENEQVPFFHVPEVNISMQWRPLIRKQILAVKVQLIDPEINFVDAEQEEAQQFGTQVNWRDALQETLQVDIDEFHVQNGTAIFRNFSSEPPVNIRAEDINLTAYNLTNARNPEGARDATLQGTATFLQHAPLEVEAAFDPLLRMESFDFRLRVTDVDLTRLNDFAEAYGKFDFSSGQGDLVVEVEAVDSQLSGYIKPLLHNVEVFSYEQDVQNEEKGFFQGLWEAVVHGGQEVLENQSEDQLATQIEVSGSLDNPDISPLQAFFSILRNAFVEAFTAQFGYESGTEE